MPKRVRSENGQGDRKKKRQKSIRNVGITPETRKKENEDKKLSNMIMRKKTEEFEDESISSHSESEYQRNEDIDEIEEFSSDDEDPLGAKDATEIQSEDSDLEDKSLSIDEKRLKFAKELTEKFQTSSTDIKEALIDQRKLILEKKDKALFDITEGIENGRIRTEQIFLKGHKNSVTCLTLVETSPHIAYSGGKDCCILRWDLNAQKKILFSKGRRNVEIEGGGHEAHILSVSVSHDDRYLVSGGLDNIIKVWDIRSGKLLDNLDGHFSKITGLTFRKGTYDFYSCSEDRTVRAWDASEQAMAACLYGHTDAIHDIHALENETCITGGADTSLRFWKIDQETQLLYSGHKYSIDSARMISETSFLTGSQDGSVAIWRKTQMKPYFKFPDAHGGKWISSVGAVPYGNLAASGSSDGYIRLYKTNGRQGLTMIKSIPQHGFVNCIEFGMRPGVSGNRFMAYGVGLDHRLGRWDKINKVKTGLGIVKFVDI